MEDRLDFHDRLDASLNATFDRIEFHIRSLLGMAIREKARWQIDEIALQAGYYTLVENLTLDDRRVMHLNADTTGISDEDLKRFRQGDIIMQVENEDGEICYIAVEASYIADDRDTNVAGRNAELLTRFTGCPALAVIASVCLDPSIKPLIAAGEFFWYEMDEPR